MSFRTIQEKLTSPAVLIGLSLGGLFVICLYPFLVLGYKITFPAPTGEFSLKYISSIFESKSVLTAFKNTAIVSLLTGIISVAIALPLSWLFTRTDLKGSSRWRSLFCLPYAIPPYLGAIAWIYLANPSNGLINEFLGTSFFNIYTMTGLIWVMSTFFFTFVLLSVLASLDRMDPSLEEAARLSGASPVHVFFDITLPIVRPSIFSGFLLVVLAAAASFGVPALIGNPANIYLLTTRIYTFQKAGSIAGLYKGGALSIVLLVLAIVILVINKKLLSKGHYETVAGKTARPSVLPLKAMMYPVIGFLLFLWGVLFVLPISGILITALSKVQGVFTLDNFGFQNFHRIFFDIEETPRAFMNSLKLAFGAATICTFLGLLLAYIQSKTRIKGRGAIDLLASLPYSTPGTVLALALILSFSSNFLGLPISLYNTLTLIGIAYMAKYLNFAVRTAGDGLGQIDDVLAEAARVSGASWWTTLKTIWFPLMKPALFASWFLVFMPAFSELTMTILLSGPGLETLGTLIFQMQEYSDVSGGGAAVLSIIVIVFVAGINTLIKVLSKGKYGL